jgi:hypothetical protein
MLVKNKKSGEVEAMRHGPATDAVTAGTHTFANVETNDKGEQVLKADNAKKLAAADLAEVAAAPAVRDVPNAPATPAAKK